MAINGEYLSSNAIADFGPDTFVLSDTKDSLMNYVASMLQNSRNVVNSVDKHKTLINQYEKVLAVLNPNQANDNTVRELKKGLDNEKEKIEVIIEGEEEKAKETLNIEIK